MEGLIDYDKASKLSSFGVPENCPNCKRDWKPEPPPMVIMQERWFGAKRMAQKYHKICEFCGHTHVYYG